MFLNIAILILFNNALTTSERLNENFRKYARNLSNRNSSDIDNLYYCSSYSKKNPIDWILRHKKCYNFGHREENYSNSYNTCSKIPYASINHLIHKNEFDVLKKEINFYDLYINLNKMSFKVWLADNEHADHICSNKSYAPIVKYDNYTCRNGCMDCVPRSNKAFYICVKNCDWKVPFNSFCNTMNISDYYIDRNLYYKGSDQIYVCQGDLKCIDYTCLCENKKKFIHRYKCI
ncbi:unnamed protein product [Brachionus calyciflorus]|uniref:Uncharacterized protein n=1 Tax=Brachionus calyciflorus TaxID=104777 RepID=A0A813SE72_9BILA|nr:unnamed protein product [Brachionus calyciflorus]